MTLYITEVVIGALTLKTIFFNFSCVYCTTDQGFLETQNILHKPPSTSFFWRLHQMSLEKTILTI